MGSLCSYPILPPSCQQGALCNSHLLPALSLPGKQQLHQLERGEEHDGACSPRGWSVHGGQRGLNYSLT